MGGQNTLENTVAGGRIVLGKRNYLRGLFKLSFTSCVICMNLFPPTCSELLYIKGQNTAKHHKQQKEPR